MSINQIFQPDDDDFDDDDDDDENDNDDNNDDDDPPPISAPSRAVFQRELSTQLDDRT